MEEQLIEFQTGQLAKTKGFNVPCDARWWAEPASDWKQSKQGVVKCNNSEEDSISRPTQSLLQAWLRKTHGIKLWCTPHEYSSSDGWAFNLLAYKEGKVTVFKGNQASSVHLTYEQALEEGLQEALKHI
jgi:hypothetical protein